MVFPFPQRITFNFGHLLLPSLSSTDEEEVRGDSGSTTNLRELETSSLILTRE